MATTHLFLRLFVFLTFLAWASPNTISKDDCVYSAATANYFWAWVSESGWVIEGASRTTTITSTITLVDIVDTASSVMSTRTVLPDMYMSQNFNLGGTRITTLTWTRSGKPTTSVLVFPTGVVIWPTGVSWSGNLSLPGSGIVSTGAGTAYISSNPQPDVDKFTQDFGPSEIGNDTRGFFYHQMLLTDTEGFYLSMFPDLFTDQPVIQSCRALMTDGPWGGDFTVVQWATSKTTSFADPRISSTPGAAPGSGVGSDGPEKTGSTATSTAVSPSQSHSAAGTQSGKRMSQLLLLGFGLVFFAWAA
ncbi:hypothetical protein PG985_012806 [Apiospora marii]|uniref:DOMON domain-containing protein n=1 Tax=Apiospora marii TaxID=335849 RepID=A0ABR1RC94_9PEZI